jgi:hypothetical protein
MALKYSDRPQVNYGGRQPDNWQARFPAHARPIASAPIGARAVRVYEPSGRSALAIHHLGAWREVSFFRDAFSGQVTPRMNGNLVNNPVAWTSS